MINLYVSIRNWYFFMFLYFLFKLTLEQSIIVYWQKQLLHVELRLLPSLHHRLSYFRVSQQNQFGLLIRLKSNTICQLLLVLSWVGHCYLQVGLHIWSGRGRTKLVLSVIVDKDLWLRLWRLNFDGCRHFCVGYFSYLRGL